MILIYAKIKRLKEIELTGDNEMAGFDPNNFKYSDILKKSKLQIEATGGTAREHMTVWDAFMIAAIPRSMESAINNCMEHVITADQVAAHTISLCAEIADAAMAERNKRMKNHEPGAR